MSSLWFYLVVGSFGGSLVVEIERDETDKELHVHIPSWLTL